MNNKEAINIISQMIKDEEGFLSDNTVKAHKMAIKALEQEPCEDAISRQAVLKAIDAKAWEFCDYLISKGRNDEQKPVSHFADNLRECIGEGLPPVNPQPKTGHWIAQDIHNCHTDFKCSECGYIHSFMHIYGEPTADYTYCPNCGAKMFESQESEE